MVETHRDKETAPKEAFSFAYTGKDAIKFSMDEEGKEPSKARHLSIIGYSGQVIKNHWWWDDLVIDVEGMSFPKETYPILMEHDTEKAVGFTATPEVVDNQVVVREGTLLNTDAADEFYENSKLGFPYEASVWVEPLNIEYVENGGTATVNGMTLDGPVTIFRNSTFKEVSVCTFGWDSQTSSAALSRMNANKSEEPKMATKLSVSEVKEQHPDAFAAIVAEAKAESAETITKLSNEVETLNTKLSAATEAAKVSDTAKSELEVRLAKLEKDSAIRDEQDRRAAFSAKLSAKLSASELPERLHTMFAKGFSMDTFLGEDGKVDEAKFSAAFDAEMGEWKTALSDSDSAVQGGGARFSKTATTTSDNSGELEEIATRLAKQVNPNYKSAE